MADQKIVVKQNTFLESLKQIVATANGYSQKAQKFLSNKKMTSIIVASMAVISFVIACIFGVMLFLRTKAINTQTAQLTNLLYYSID
jgi:cell division protein FtsB